jgi:hypothetical protein
MGRKKVEKPSDELLKLIELANLAPRKPKPLPSYEFLVSQIYFEKTGKTYPKIDFDLHYSLDNSLRPSREEFEVHQKAEEEALEKIKKITKKYPALYHYVFDETEETEYNTLGQPSRFQLIDKYGGVLAIQRLVISLAIHITVFVEGFGLKEFAQMPYKRFSDEIFPIKYQFKDGKLKFEITQITNTLENIDFRRLRFCGVCRSVFWAYRLNAKYCDDICGNRFRVEKANAKKAEKERKRKEERENFKNQNFSKKEGK